MIRNRNVLQTRICQRRERDGAFRQTLVVDTDLSNPLKDIHGDSYSAYRKLVNDLQAIQELSNNAFVGFDKIEIQGSRWRASI